MKDSFPTQILLFFPRKLVPVLENYRKSLTWVQEDWLFVKSSLNVCLMFLKKDKNQLGHVPVLLNNNTCIVCSGISLLPVLFQDFYLLKI